MAKLKSLGARYDRGSGETTFRVWAPHVKTLGLVLNPEGQSETFAMKALGGGDFELVTSKAGPGVRYKYQLDQADLLPDPCSRYQPEGPMGPSQVVATEFEWQDVQFSGLSLKEMVLYEIHVGTFTAEGTFDSAIEELDRLRDLGINAIEVMPVSQFSGDRNWGYDGVYPFAVQNTYGGPEAFKRFIKACHQRDMAVVLDVVYNHLGPEGNFLPRYFPVFQDKYHTPWGQAINFDGPHSDGVKAYFLQTTEQWLSEFQIDGLRLDAIQTILDTSPYPFLEQLTDLKREIENKTHRHIQIIGETDMNDPKVVTSPERGGLGLDAHWNDDFHHTLHGLLSGESQGYFKDYSGLEDLKRLYKDRVAFNGRYSDHKARSHGRSYQGVGPERLMICNHNHDQIGNRAMGDRKSTYLGFEELKLAGAAVLLSPFLPMLYMGEEYGETAPFQYFVSHESQELNKAVQEGRRSEFKAFDWKGEVPDPVARETFENSKIDTSKANEPQGQALSRLYRDLIKLSKEIRLKNCLDPDSLSVSSEGSVLMLSGGGGFKLQFNFGKTDANLKVEGDEIEWVIDTSLYQPGVSESDLSANQDQRRSELASGSIRIKPHSALAYKGHA